VLIASLSERISPLLLAALAGWIMCTCLHEFAHALVAYWGGDRSVREKGYLSVDPTRFIDPVFSLLIPAIVLLLGGFPFPGASVQIDHSRLRSERWAALVAAAGPITNFVLFLLLALPLHPNLGLVNPFVLDQPTWVDFLGAMATLNFIATLFNLIPVPPLDGFGMIEHQLDRETQWKLRQPQVTWMCFLALLLALRMVPPARRAFFYMFELVSSALGLPLPVMLEGYNVVIFNESFVEH
jgi:Zn-dependent protease